MFSETKAGIPQLYASRSMKPKVSLHLLGIIIKLAFEKISGKLS
jgi:hypothetical protein